MSNYAYAGFSQPCRDRRQKSDRLERRMNRQGDQTRCKLVTETEAFGFLSSQDKCRSLALTEGEERPRCHRDFRLFRNRAEHENARLHFRFHAGQEHLKIDFAGDSQ
jgi:hypothetical protein